MTSDKLNPKSIVIFVTYLKQCFLKAMWKNHNWVRTENQ